MCYRNVMPPKVSSAAEHPVFSPVDEHSSVDGENASAQPARPVARQRRGESFDGLPRRVSSATPEIRPEPARRSARLPFVRDIRSQGPHAIPSAEQIESDRNWGGDLLPGLKTALLARTNQGAAFLTHFSDEEMSRWEGACNGQCHIWMRLREASPLAAATDRLNALASFEGTVHANIHQSAYSDNRADDFSIGRLLGIDAWSSKPGTHDAIYTKTINDLNRMALHVNSHSNLRMEMLPRALETITGYAMLRLSLPGRQSPRHTWAIHNAGQGHMTLFDPNYGEFHVPNNRLPDFLRTLNEQIKLDLGNTVARIDIAPCIVNPEFDDTPVAALCRSLLDSGQTSAPSRSNLSSERQSVTEIDQAGKPSSKSQADLRRRGGKKEAEL